MCKLDMVICGKCGNNSCNGGERCDICSTVREFEQNTTPPNPKDAWITHLCYTDDELKNVDINETILTLNNYLDAGYDFQEAVDSLPKEIINKNQLDITMNIRNNYMNLFCKNK